MDANEELLLESLKLSALVFDKKRESIGLYHNDKPTKTVDELITDAKVIYNFLKSR